MSSTEFLRVARLQIAETMRVILSDQNACVIAYMIGRMYVYRRCARRADTVPQG